MRKTEPIVQYTLEPLVYEGPAEGWQREQWKLKSPTAILDLKVCDMTMGSGAFLVQACRYLAERLVEAWENAEKEHPGKVLITPDGTFSEGSPAERLVPADASERIAIARRVVADRCLYGVDINPMAVEMAKLSLWLITDLPRLLAEHVADQIVLVEPLHDDDDGATALVIEPAVEGMDEPLVAGLPQRLGERVLGFQRVIDQDEVGTAPGPSRRHASVLASSWGRHAEQKVCRLFAGGNRIRTIGPTLVKGLSAVADERCRTDSRWWYSSSSGGRCWSV